MPSIVTSTRYYYSIQCIIILLNIGIEHLTLSLYLDMDIMIFLIYK